MKEFFIFGLKLGEHCQVMEIDTKTLEYFLENYNERITTNLDRASIRIPSVIKEIFEKLLIEAVNGVIKSQQNKLWNAFPAETSGNLK